MDWVFSTPPSQPDTLRQAVRQSFRIDETAAVKRILKAAEFSPPALSRIAATARRLVMEARRRRHGKSGIDAFLNEFALSSREGIALMCLAEAMLRISDAETVDRLIRDKLASADWARHLGHSTSLFINASTWALMLTGRLVHDDPEERDWAASLRRFVARTSEPVLRQAVTAAMRILGHQFVMGRTIAEALGRAQTTETQGYRFSYDMLGEAALTADDAARYAARYREAIAAIGGRVAGRGVHDAPGISVKLSALHPRYEESQRGRVLRDLPPVLLALARQAKDVGIGLAIDAEEADRLDLSLDLIEALAGASDLAGWDGLGLAVQAYQKRALPLIDWLAALARRNHRRLMLRLVKGAYWDSEIKRTQERGLEFYPVYTRKLATDVSYLACAKRIWAARDAFFPQFATHNAYSVAAALEIAGADRGFEFQRLHGMGEALYDQIVGTDAEHFPCRVYAPVGSHEELLAYLVRRLLENGANTSFVNRLVDEAAPVETLVADPAARLDALGPKPHPRIKAPSDLYAPERRNSCGLDLADPSRLAELSHALEQVAQGQWSAAAILGGKDQIGAKRAALDPADRRRVLGWVSDASPPQIDAALTAAAAAASGWDKVPAGERAACLERAADLLESRPAEFIALIVREGGRTIPDAFAELREAIDHCRYDAARARADFTGPVELPGPTGERNLLTLNGRGVFACISPWNFPLAIFLGQAVAALAAGNAVIAKPAEQTPLVAAAAIRLLHEAGIPGDVVQFLPGDGPVVGARLVADERVAGISFTGSTDTARAINRALAERGGPIVPFIAETGGQNVLIADSSALAEQLVADLLYSAFDSAGQRCSSARVLFVQADIAERVIAMLAGAMDELVIGDPTLIATDIGPVIDEAACAALEDHAQRMAREARLIRALSLPPGTEHGVFFAPRVFEIDRLDRLTGEVFGPILHVIRWQGNRLDRVLDAIDATGFGLTLGIHSRIDETVRVIHRRLRIGNTYVNRNMIGAVVGVQPFGGERLSGTGPKIGGPHYLQRFATERTLAIDITAAGGNAGLMSLQDDAET